MIHLKIYNYPLFIYYQVRIFLILSKNKSIDHKNFFNRFEIFLKIIYIFLSLINRYEILN